MGEAHLSCVQQAFDTVDTCFVCGDKLVGTNVCATANHKRVLTSYGLINNTTMPTLTSNTLTVKAPPTKSENKVRIDERVEDSKSVAANNSIKPQVDYAKVLKGLSSKSDTPVKKQSHDARSTYTTGSTKNDSSERLKLDLALTSFSSRRFVEDGLTLYQVTFPNQKLTSLLDQLRTKMGLERRVAFDPTAEAHTETVGYVVMAADVPDNWQDALRLYLGLAFTDDLYTYFACIRRLLSSFMPDVHEKRFISLMSTNNSPFWKRKIVRGVGFVTLLHNGFDISTKLADIEEKSDLDMSLIKMLQQLKLSKDTPLSQIKRYLFEEGKHDLCSLLTLRAKFNDHAAIKAYYF